MVLIHKTFNFNTITLIDTLNYGKEKENECFAQGLVGKTRK